MRFSCGTVFTCASPSRFVVFRALELDQTVCFLSGTGLSLKGGLLVSSIIGIQRRTTADMDASIRSLVLSGDSMRQMFEEIIAIDPGDNVTFDINRISGIMEWSEHPGIRLDLTGQLERVRTPLRVDVSASDVITPGPVEYPFRLMSEDRAIPLKAYNLETVLAEKLHAILTRGEMNSRMRGYYDICQLVSLRGNEIDPAVMSDALAATFENRDTSGFLESAGETLSKVCDSSMTRTWWGAYAAEFPYAKELSWSTVIQSVHDLAALAGL